MAWFSKSTTSFFLQVALTTDVFLHQKGPLTNNSNN